MKNHIYFIIICFLSMSCKESNNSEHSKKDYNISISVEQNGKLIQPINGIITLDKQPFNVVFKASKPFDVMLNASFNDSIYNLAQNPKPLTEQEHFKETAAIAEVLFNEDKNMFLSKDATNIWYFEDEKLLAVDAINNGKAYVLGTKFIKGGQLLNKTNLIDSNVEFKPVNLLEV